MVEPIQFWSKWGLCELRVVLITNAAYKLGNPHFLYFLVGLVGTVSLQGISEHKTTARKELLQHLAMFSHFPHSSSEFHPFILAGCSNFLQEEVPCD